jgi:serine/threonine protein kinase
MSETLQFAMVSEWMPNGNINEFVKRRPEVNRFELVSFLSRSPPSLLLVDHHMIAVAGRSHEGLGVSAQSGNGPRGPQGGTFSRARATLFLTDIVKVNILIDETGHARLADFGLLAIISDATSHVSSSLSTHGGTCRWMSPELLCPEKFGLEDNRPTESSDCYALGMVIYEVLSGQLPFSHHGGYTVVVMVLEGQRPRWPQGAEGMYEDVQEVLERCWKPNPDDRPKIEDVLLCLEGVSGFWSPLSRMVAHPPTADSPTQSYSHPDTEGTTGEREAPSPSQLSQMLPPKGDADDKIRLPILPDAFTAPLYEVTNNQVGAYVRNPSESHLEASVAVPDRVGRT